MMGDFLIPWKATPFCPQELREVGFGSWADDFFRPPGKGRGFDVGQTIDFRLSIGFLYINMMDILWNQEI